MAVRWNFTPLSPEKPLTAKPSAPLSEEQGRQLKSRREQFKKRLLINASPPLTGRDPSVELTGIDDQELGLESDSGGDSDTVFKELTDMFSHNGKGKGKGKGKAAAVPVKRIKKPEIIGPSGQSYTPLELQVSHNPFSLQPHILTKSS